jgi:hypothetical protein
MKTTTEIQNSATDAAGNAFVELRDTRPLTLCALARIETNLRIASAQVNALKNRASGTEGREGQ